MLMLLKRPLAMCYGMTEVYSKKHRSQQIVDFFCWCCYHATMKQNQIQADQALIMRLGGPSALAKKLNTSKQRVHNWMSRGIPAFVKLEFPKIFLKK